MTQTPVNILELLMGSLGAQPAGQTNNGSEAAGLFGDIFGQLLSQTNGADIKSLLSSPDQGSLPVFDGLLGLPGKTGIIGEMAGEAQDKTSLFSQELASLLPQSGGTFTPNIKELMSDRFAQLPEGNYRILGSSVEGGKLSLELENQNLPGQSIKLILSADSIANLSDLNNQAAQRVALDGITSETAKFDDLLSQLNLKELRIENAGIQQQTGEAKQPVQISLVTESSAGELVLRANLDRSRIRAFAEGSGEAANKALESIDGQKSQIPKILESMQAVNGVQGKGSIVLQPENDYYLGTMLGGNAKASTMLGNRIPVAQPDLFAFGRDTGDKSQSSNSLESFQSAFGGTELKTAVDSHGNQIARADVRFNLPMDIKTALKPNGQSITLRIEPENLGPAKLSLSLRDDKLTAKISVESAPAKAALESNLDRLVSQLAKADISVDQIEITITGDSAHNEFFQRQPHWQHRVSYRSSQSDDISSESDGIPVAEPLLSAAQYAGPSGVNLLA